MPVVEQTALIKAPPPVVMAALGEVEMIPSWATVEGAIENVQGQGVGMRYAWRYTINTLHFQGHSEVIEQSADTLITKTSGDVESIWTIKVRPAGGHTALRVMVEYHSPHNFMELMTDVVLQQLNNPAVAQENLNRFKEMVESRAVVLE